MKERRRETSRLVLGATLVIASVLILGAVAGAAPPECKPKDCPDPTPTTQPSPLEACTSEVISGISATGRTEVECLWTPKNAGTIVGSVTVEADPGAISGVVVFVRDDSPGDICVLEQDWDGQTGPSYTASFDLAYGDLPDPFAEYANQTYWSWDGPHWCYPQDGDSDMRDDSNGKDLHLHVSFRAKKGSTVDITLNPPQEPASP